MEKKIDITQKAPEQKEKNFKNDFKKFLFYLVQWTWGLPVNRSAVIAEAVIIKILMSAEVRNFLGLLNDLVAP